MPDFKLSDLKSLFDTPQKARLTIICLIVTLATLGAVAVYILYSLRGAAPEDSPPQEPSAAVSVPAESVPPVDSDPPDEPSAAAGLIPTLTIDEARELALADAGLSQEEAEFSREAMADDNGIWVYQFRFRTNSAQYEYLLNANTGDIRSKVKEALSTPSPSQDMTEPPMPSLPALSESLPPAESPSQSDPGSPPPASQTPADTPSPTPTQSASMYIGMDRAKAAALAHAGLSADQVRFTHLQMGREDGRRVYEVEFRQNGVEYEYTIDASTGRVLSHERDTD